MNNSSDIRTYLDWSDRGNPSFIRYVAATAIIGVNWIFLGSLLSVPIMLLFRSAFGEGELFTIASTSSSFLLAFFTVPLVTRYVLKRPWWSFGFPRWTVDYRLFGIAVLVSVLTGVGFVVAFGLAGYLTLKFQVPDPGQYLLMLLIAGIGLLIQSSTEEFVFRGFLTQFVRRYVNHPIAFLGLPTLLFAALHIGNIASVGGHWYAAVPYFAQGALFAWVAYRTGALWIAIGLHWANNFGNVVLIGTDIDIIPSLAPIIISNPPFAVVVAATAASTLAAFVVLEIIFRRTQRQ